MLIAKDEAGTFWLYIYEADHDSSSARSWCRYLLEDVTASTASFPCWQQNETDLVSWVT